MRKATQTLPEGYTRAREINLAKDKTMAWVVNVVGLFAFCPFWWWLTELVWRLRPYTGTEEGLFNAGLPFWLYIVYFFALFLGMLALHEMVHAFFFWLFTGSRPVFGLSSIYIYAAAPGWYLSAGQYMIVGLSPLLIVTALFFFLALWVSDGWVPVVSMLAAANAIGSAGDLWIVFQLLLSGPGCLVSDQGPAVCFYEQRF